jgi:hypothetical protein
MSVSGCSDPGILEKRNDKAARILDEKDQVNKNRNRILE